MNNKPLKPSLKFISKLPTIKIKEEVETPNMVIWKVELDKPVVILYGDYPVLNTFWVEIRTSSCLSICGWKREMKICIKKTKSARDFIIDFHEDDFYTKVKWWDWYRP